MNKLTLIVKATIKPDQQDSYNAYITNLMASYEKVGATRLSYYPIHETYIGEKTPSFIGVFEFPDREAFNSVYESPEYKQTLIPLRDKAFEHLEVYISQ